MAIFNLKVNSKEYQVDVDPSTPMLWVLRDHLNLVGTKFGCGIAQCGACTILVEWYCKRCARVSLLSIQLATRKLQPSKGFLKMAIIRFNRHGLNMMFRNVVIARVDK